jgi:hypothetical protein
MTTAVLEKESAAEEPAPTPDIQEKLDQLRESVKEATEAKKISLDSMSTVIVTMGWGQPFIFDNAIAVYADLLKHIRSGHRTMIEIPSPDGIIAIATEHVAMLQRSTMEILKAKAEEARARAAVLAALQAGPQR